MTDEGKDLSQAKYPAIIRSLKSPLSVFGLAMLICNAIFSISAAWMNSLEAFIYSIHTFLAIVFAFVGIAIWSPRSLYHPAELAGIEVDLQESKHSKLILTAVIIVAGLAYTGYQLATSNNYFTPSQCACEESKNKPS